MVEKRGPKYLAALRDGRMHDAHRIVEGKDDQETIVFDRQHNGGSYRFFGALVKEVEAVKSEDLDKSRFVVSKIKFQPKLRLD